MLSKLILSFLFSLATIFCYSQTQSIKGTIVEEGTGIPIPYANVILLNTSPAIGTTSDDDGNFYIAKVPIGRYDIQASFIGYETTLKKDVDVNSAKTVELEFILQESLNTLDEVVVKPNVDKEHAINSMALLSAKMLSVEEANRYAGGFNDPARLAASFAGVSSGVNNNGIVVRGNSPKSMQWKLEDIEIPNPNHFADLVSFGGGALTALSSQLLANSDFLTGAFPAEYNNAFSGVFDIKMRKGNNEDREHTFQLGAMGIELASEGPFKKGKQASYLFNYRYSTFGLVGLVTGAEEGIKYQDASFKINLPTKNTGVFSLWGIGLIDEIIVAEERDSSLWKYRVDGERYIADQYMAASGLNHRMILNKKSSIKSSLGFTTNNTDWQLNQLDPTLALKPKSVVQATNSTYVLRSTLNTKFSKTHTNRTGFSFTNLAYKSLIKNKLAPSATDLTTIVDENGNSNLWSTFTSSNFRFANNITLNAGLNFQLFTLNDSYTIEPRLAVKWDLAPNQSLGLAYGLHSRLEKLNFYFTKNQLTGVYNNKEMDFAKSHHFVASYSYKFSENWLLKAEPYYQILYNIPVIEDSYYSFLNQDFRDAWFINDDFQNSGSGRNIGIDLTLEKYFSKGFYMLATASLFDSKYKGGDNIWRNTKFNKKYIVNLLAGKEWYFGSNNSKNFGINIRTTFQGGDWYVPSLAEESKMSESVVYDYDQAFTTQFDPNLLVHFTLNYKWNKVRTTQEVALKFLNATGYGDFRGFEYNLDTQDVDATSEVIIIPNLSYKISF